ncbi:hypothetical protein GIB67_013053 [Kingdonia uniflora]|uniref:Photolyase/cryptochrome alpha/beta domain-containing protein n=1 Tax=Kingdonia uniflora TaxID=39325 RepID=A0A7J7MCH6_9MAGN|nr:hypothetical protein GIB67_013053 [Kingdonia uniflora]
MDLNTSVLNSTAVLLSWQHLYCTTTQASSYRPIEKKVAVIWFKHDLRTDDHSALISASRYNSVLPLYIFDRRIISRFSDETLELVLMALNDLKTSLKDQGSDLMIRFGGAETVIPELVSDLASHYTAGLKSVDVFVEEEVEYDLRRMIGTVEESLLNPLLSQGKPSRILLWRTPFYDIENLKELPAFYCDFENLKYSRTTPLESPVLPRLDIDLDLGTLPTFDDVKRYLDDNPQRLKVSWTSVKGVSAISILRKKKFDQGKTQSDLLVESKANEGNEVDSNFKRRKVRKLESSLFISKEGNVVGGGTHIVLNALAAYLRYLEGTSRDDWQEVHEKLRVTESRYGASFGALFGSAIFLGIVSRRRVYYEAIKYERDRNAGFLSPFGFSASSVATAADTVCSMEWYWLMALKSQVCKEGRYPVRIWRWNGHLIQFQYTVVGHEGPAILLVHGFGAFLEHYRDNLDAISGSGNRVYAITLLGFGKSEKPNIVYTEIMWAELLRDFIIDVVGEPAHVVGNSIGGYLVANLAGLWPSLAKSVVLVNTAGWVVAGKSSIQIAEERQTSCAAWLGGRLLLLYLRSRVGNIVKNCYPINKGRADDWLINEMQRAGMKDPLSNSKKSLSMLREHCNGIVIKELEAGHCPHDERPDEVNLLITEWVVTAERSLQLC